jgi:hypothetical protein
VERILAIAPDAAVVALCTAADKALVAQAVRAGAAGSLDRSASPGETVTALQVYKRRRRGEAVDMSLAEPPAQTMNLRVSGALPRFPEQAQEPVPYQPMQRQPQAGDDDTEATEDETSLSAGDPAATNRAGEAATAASPEPQPSMPSPPPPTPPPPSRPPPTYTPQAPGAVAPEGGSGETATEIEAEAPAEHTNDPDDAVAHLRDMLRQEAEAAGAGVGPAKRKRGFLGLFKGKEEPAAGWGPKTDGKQDKKDQKEKEAKS